MVLEPVISHARPIAPGVSASDRRIWTPPLLDGQEFYFPMERNHLFKEHHLLANFDLKS